MKKSLFLVNVFLSTLTIFFTFFFLFLIPYQTTNMTQRFGISPRVFPYFLGYTVLMGGLIVFIDSLLNKVEYNSFIVLIFSKNEYLRLFYFLITFSLVPILTEFLGLFVGIIIILVLLLLLSGVRSKITIIATTLITFLLIYGIFLFLKIRIPSGLLF